MSVWGKLASRYEGKEKWKHRLLALDGGGIRGILTLEILDRLEILLREEKGGDPDFRLCHFFDYIGGTSTGAIIAAGLVMGMSTKDLLKFYQKTGPAMFDKQSVLRRWYGLYKAEPLVNELQKTFKVHTTLEPDNLECLLMVVTSNRTTDSPWPISSNPQAVYNDILRPDCNLKIPLWQIVRASTAAPVYFPPEVIQWDKRNEEKTFVFVDGGMTPFNNPAFLLYRMATVPAYRLNWETGESKLLVISVGTGAAATVEEGVDDPDRGVINNVSGIPGSLMYAAMVEQDTLCRQVGRCVHGAPLDREIGDMIPRHSDGSMISLKEDLGRKFLYARYSADLSHAGLKALGLDDIVPKNVQKLDSVNYMDDLQRVGRKIAEDINLMPFDRFLRDEE